MEKKISKSDGSTTTEADRTSDLMLPTKPKVPETREHVRHFYFFGQDAVNRSYHSGLAGTVAIKYDRGRKAIKFGAAVVHKNDLGKASKRDGYANAIDRLRNAHAIPSYNHKFSYMTPVLWVLDELAEVDQDSADEFREWVNGTKKGLSAKAVRSLSILYLDSYSRNIKHWFAKGELTDVMKRFLGKLVPPKS
jgi:hypothetical protein